jgi:hypothetical protein
MMNCKGFRRKGSWKGIFFERLREITKILRIDEVQTEIRTKHLPNTNHPERYSCVRPLNELLELTANIPEVY